MIITTESTYDEINAVLKAAYDPIMKRAYGYTKMNIKKLLALCAKYGGHYTPQRELSYNTNGINIKTVQVDLHPLKVDGDFRKKHGITQHVKMTTVDASEYLMYSIMEDLNTGKKVFVDFCYQWRYNQCGDVVFISTHGIQRYAKRNFPDEKLTFEETCSRLVRRIYAKNIMKRSLPYGTTNFNRALMIVTDGVFLGYEDSDRNVFCMDTFLSMDMLPKLESFWIPEEYAVMKATTDAIMNHKCLQYLRVRDPKYVMLRKDKKGKVVQDKSAGEDEQITPVKELDKDFLKNYREIMREHYVNKMKRKGYQ